MSRYGIKDVFLTVQGEGARAGTKAVFVRFTGCNLWDGLPHHRDRGVGPCAQWCDTDFAKGTVMELGELTDKMGALWPAGNGARWCVLTGGEPCLQIDKELLLALTDLGWHVAVETNGTVENDAVLQFARHICVAPKRGTPWWTLRAADELKVVLPGAMPGEQGWTDEELVAVEARASQLAFGSTRESFRAPVQALYVQPQDPLVSGNFVEQTALKRSVDVDADAEEQLELRLRRNLQLCITWVMAHPRWRLSMQLHKFIGMQ